MQFDAVTDMLGPSLRVQLPAHLLEDGWRATISATGDPHQVGSTVSTDAGDGLRTMSVPVTCARGDITVMVSVDDKQSIVGLRLKHDVQQGDWAPPAYVDVSQFTEHTVTVSAAGLAVTGALCIPNAATPVPAVILLAGSGPMDRDGTLSFSNKPLRDFAWGLATRGIATLRYDKATLVHPDHFSSKSDITVVDEYHAHAAAALALLKARPEIDADKLFLAGHSQGGTVAPRIAAQTDALAGLIILAGAVQPPHHAALRQIRYLASLDPDIDPAADPSIALLTHQAARVDSLDPSRPPPSNELPFGVPAAYWLDLLAYDPIATAAGLKLPMLILQGGRDYQVTIADDLERWKDALSTRSDVTISVYPSVDHQFFSGHGPSTPSTYREPQHVAQVVIVDIAAWIATVRQVDRQPTPGHLDQR